MQATWDDFTEPASPPEQSEESGYTGRPLDPHAGCPWCLSPPELFDVNDMGELGCRVCDAVQPTHMEWYQNGEKIVDLYWAARMFQATYERLKSD